MDKQKRLFLLDAYALILEDTTRLSKTRESTPKGWTLRQFLDLQIPCWMLLKENGPTI